ncbi:hypothetical protein N9N56_01015, partial [Candidatus Pelagibacter ubique]|nr:hypothetical protein [Candidatus Pelagibacter ubique]
ENIMSNEKQIENDVIINFNGRDFKAEDLNEDQANIAAKLNVAQRKLQRLQDAYEDYVITAEYREMQVKAFSETVEEEVTEE